MKSKRGKGLRKYRKYMYFTYMVYHRTEWKCFQLFLFVQPHTFRFHIMYRVQTNIINISQSTNKSDQTTITEYNVQCTEIGRYSIQNGTFFRWRCISNHRKLFTGHCILKLLVQTRTIIVGVRMGSNSIAQHDRNVLPLQNCNTQQG